MEFEVETISRKEMERVRKIELFRLYGKDQIKDLRREHLASLPAIVGCKSDPYACERIKFQDSYYVVPEKVGFVELRKLLGEGEIFGTFMQSCSEKVCVRCKSYSEKETGFLCRINRKSVYSYVLCNNCNSLHMSRIEGSRIQDFGFSRKGDSKLLKGEKELLLVQKD